MIPMSGNTEHTKRIERARRIAKLEREIAAIKDEQQRDQQAAFDAVRPVYRFTLLPTDDKFDKVYDPSCVFYYLKGEVLNIEEMEAVGKQPFQGGMKYLYNTLSESFVMSTGGGCTFHRRENTEALLIDLAEFIATDGNGGDVTEIVNRYRS